MSINTISVIGLGYIGLPTAAMFASKEKRVIGVDVNQYAVDTINAGKIHIVEPDLDVLVKDAVASGFLTATVTPEPADAFIIAVPTPFLLNGGQGSTPTPDLSYIESAARGIAKVLKKGDLVVLESTSPVGATEKMVEWLSQERSDLSFPGTPGVDCDVRVAYCPERVLPGKVVKELVMNDRIIGGVTEACSQAAIELYKLFVEGACSVTSVRTAEMAKLTENASRDVSIAFANELSIICDNINVNVWELIELANRHPRVNILQPGPGVGGHCIAVDPWFIIANSEDDARLIRAARDVNDRKPQWVVDTIIAETRQDLASSAKSIPKVFIFGLTFKPNIDDVRQSPALEITKNLAQSQLFEISVIEPNLDSKPVSLGSNIIFHQELYSFPDDALIVVLVDHDIYRDQVNALGKTHQLLDFCGAKIKGA